MSRKSTRARIGVAFLLAPAMMVLAGGPALAADNVVVSNSETVQAHLNADGTVQDARVYEQISLQGKGTITIKNPVSTANLRNLDGFGGFEVQDGKMVSTQSVDGESSLRGVSDYDKQLPLKVSVTYKLDGKTVEAGDVVGKDGRLDVRYKVENVTGKDQNVTYDDGTGRQVTQTQKVVIPMVGSMTTVLPASFADVASDEANMAGDGRGQTKMSFTMTLFGPIGSPTAEFGYSARVTGGLIPDATISALPVSPLDSPSFKGGAASYKGGADTGVKLTAGATEIDANVLKLRDGAQTLIGGLIQLRDGAQALNSGLAVEAAPGATKLADGASRMDTGAGQLRKAFNSHSGGSDLTAGSAALASGVAQLSSGLEKLSGVTGLPRALLGLQELRVGLDHPVGASGKTDPGGLLQGLRRIAGGLSNPGCNPQQPTNPQNPCGVKQGLALATLGVDNPNCSPADPLSATNRCGLKQIVGPVGARLTAASAARGDIDRLGLAVINAYRQSTMAPAKPCPQNEDTPVPPVVPPSSLVALGLPPTGVCVLLAEAAYGLELPRGVRTATDPGGLLAQTAAAGEALVLTGKGIAEELVPGLARLNAGVDELAVGSAKARDGAAEKLLPGVDSLISGISDAITGSEKLSVGALAASSGSGDLASGIVKAGAGVGRLSDGTLQVSDGAKKLAAGLGDAAAGSGKLSDGLVKAAEKGKGLPEGAARLSAEGTSKLGAAGKSTAADYGLKYAVIVAGAQRAKTEAMAYGAPAGAAGTTAYSLEISGANGDGGTSLNRGIGAVALFGAGGGLVLLRRRLV